MAERQIKTEIEGVCSMYLIIPIVYIILFAVLAYYLKETRAISFSFVVVWAVVLVCIMQGWI